MLTVGSERNKAAVLSNLEDPIPLHLAFQRRAGDQRLPPARSTLKPWPAGSAAAAQLGLLNNPRTDGFLQWAPVTLSGDPGSLPRARFGFASRIKLMMDREDGSRRRQHSGDESLDGPVAIGERGRNLDGNLIQARRARR